ncbi:MAG TPA: protein kinase [Phycisphaerae bacterium]|nr:protein kinase [Phycisphaerae bacterium]HRY71261.1 protein kinase [Phycisphaerae bacterium]
MSNGQSTSMTGDDSRASRIQAVLDDCIQRRLAGESLSDEQIIATHPDLMPELGDELRKLGRIQEARRAANQASTVNGSPLGWADETPPRMDLPGYDLVRQIGRGGQAVVYQAIQLATGRKVAVKVLLEGPFASARERSRFDREAQILAALAHPNIVQIIDRGMTSEGHPCPAACI